MLKQTSTPQHAVSCGEFLGFSLHPIWLRHPQQLFSFTTLRGRASGCVILFVLFCHIPVQGLLAQKSVSEYAVNTQPAGQHPPTPEQSVAKITVPEDFHIRLFAGEPAVHQPIAFEFDDQGRLWVVECYTYQGDYDLNLKDRIVILEDTDGDGEHDHRKIFWDEGQRVTGITLGFGGIWVTSAPNLLFIPDRDRNDVPDSAPIALLDGFSTRARHNMVNGLRWGPDGWLYGRHGITDTSHVRTADSPEGKSTKLNCSIWRYHPTRQKFEVVTHGTTNPWGLDYDQHGQWFFTNNVINHLWHVVPGAHYQRMFGDDFNPHLYELIGPTADHFHWDTKGQPGVTNNANRKKYDGRHDSHGGGHSHAGGMIYQGGKWPSSFHNAIFMCNTHGRRVNMDNLIREGNSYRATHGKDFLIANDPWFRGVELKYGPDGDVYLTDWSDLGECHDRDGVHRTSGRIYKIIYTGRHNSKPSSATIEQLVRADPEQLVRLQLDQNDWFVRHARRRLQEMANSDQNMDQAVKELMLIFHGDVDVTRKLRALWCLASINAAPEPWLLQLLNHPSAHIRLWAVQLLTDSPEQLNLVANSFTKLAETETSPLVRLFLASALQKLPLQRRWSLAEKLAMQQDDVGDRVQPLLIWYGIESAVMDNPNQAIQLAQNTYMPLLRRHTARRLASEIDSHPQYISTLLVAAAKASPDRAIDYLEGMTHAFRGRRKLTAQPRWLTLLQQHQNVGNPRINALANELLVLFGDGRTVDSLLKLAQDKDADPAARKQALRVVIETGTDQLNRTLLSLKSDRIVGADAIRGLAQHASTKAPEQLLNMYGNAKHDHRPAIIETLASRPEYAIALLQGIADGKIAAVDIPAGTASRIANLGVPELNRLLAEHWGAVRTSSKEKEKRIDHYRSIALGTHQGQSTHAAQIPPDLPNGRLLFNRLCANCHKMYGQGQDVGPDLTGSNRDSIDYLLDNLIDPSRIVPRGMRQSVFLLDDGRVMTGIPVREDNQTITIQTADRRESFPIASIERRQQQETSLMPEGLLENLGEQQVRDLFAYMQSEKQIPLMPDVNK